MFKIQLRGHCQRCGRQQAVKNGTMAHHGYTVRDGWFNGVCSGVSFQPVEFSRAALDKTVEAIRNQCAELRAEADRIEGGVLPEKLLYRANRYSDAVMTAVAEIPAPALRACLDSEVFRLRRRAEIGEAHCDYLTTVADQYHGKELIEVRPEDKPEQIRIGDKRIMPSQKNHQGEPIVATCTSLARGGKVYYTDGSIGKVTGKPLTFSTTTRSWRMWAKA